MEKWLWPGWSRHEWAQFGGAGIIAFVIVPTLAWLLCWDVNNAILWATGLVLLAYTIETQRTRMEMVRQNEIAILPVIIAAIEERRVDMHPAPPYPKALVLRNIGKGPALFLKVRDLTLTDPAGDRVRFVATFHLINYLEFGKEAVVSVAECRAIDGQIRSTRLDPLPCLDPFTALEDYDVIIDYQDASGGDRRTGMKIGKSGINLQWQGKARAQCGR